MLGRSCFQRSRPADSWVGVSMGVWVGRWSTTYSPCTVHVVCCNYCIFIVRPGQLQAKWLAWGLTNSAVDFNVHLCSLVFTFTAMAATCRSQPTCVTKLTIGEGSRADDQSDMFLIHVQHGMGIFSLSFPHSPWRARTVLRRGRESGEIRMATHSRGWRG